MDDDLAIGASVWATPGRAPITLSPPPFDQPLPSSSQDAFDDFDEFGPPPQAATTGGDDDDFGDFGDFGDAEGAVASGAGGFADDMRFDEQARFAGPSTSTQDWRPLRLDPFPSRAELQAQIDAILGPFWADDDPTEVFTDQDIREVGGLSQVLVTPESRSLYKSLFPPEPPPLPPPNWTRSRIRRQHLIALGIPVNLDEVLPRANGKPLPALQISTRPMSAPPAPRGVSRTNGSVHSSRAGSPVSAAPRDARSAAMSLGLGPKPELDVQKVEECLNLQTNDLSLLPIPALEAHLANIRAQTANTSTLLTYLLQTRDALQQDSETYNKLIAELVGEAQKMKTGVGKARTPLRRGTGS